MRPVLILPALLIATGCASVAAADADYWVRLAPAAWQADFDGDISYADATVAGAGEYGLEQLALDNDETSLALEASISLPILFDIHAGYAGFQTDGSATLDENIVVEDQVFLAGTVVASEIELSDLYAEVGWRILPIPTDMLGVTVGVALHQVDASFSVSDGLRSAGFDETLYIPALALRAYVQPIGSVRVDGRVHYLNASIGDYAGTYADVDLRVVYQPFALIGFGLGYRHQLYDLTLEDTDAQVEEASVDLTLGGPYIAVVARF
jgi:hypothetical protein